MLMSQTGSYNYLSIFINFGLSQMNCLDLIIFNSFNYHNVTVTDRIQCTYKLTPKDLCNKLKEFLRFLIELQGRCIFVYTITSTSTCSTVTPLRSPLRNQWPRAQSSRGSHMVLRAPFWFHPGESLSLFLFEGRNMICVYRCSWLSETVSSR